MHANQLISLLVACATWIGFGYSMRTYFRCAKQRSAAKTWLIIAAFACTFTQLLVIALTRHPTGVWFGVGISGYVIANCLFWWALAAHGKSHPAFAFIPVPPSSLTTAGPYRLVRHPIYAAYLLAWLAGAAVAGQPWLLAPTLVMGLVYLAAARQEERSFLKSGFSTAYQEYQRRTGMFFPHFMRLTGK